MAILKKGLSLLLAFAVSFTAFAGESRAITTSSAVYERNYVFDQTPGICTLASAVMMMRSKAQLEGNKGWENITEANVAPEAWIENAGLRRSFNIAGITVDYGDFTPGNVREEIIYLLSKHPEGVEVYERSLPHAMLMTRYDKYTDTFFCADPGVIAGEIESWYSLLARPFYNLDDEHEIQDSLIDVMDAYWVISSYNGEELSGLSSFKGSASDSKTVKKNKSGSDTVTDSDTEKNTASESSAEEQQDYVSYDTSARVTEDGISDWRQDIASPASDKNLTSKSSNAVNKESVSSAPESSPTDVNLKFDRIRSFSETSFKDLDENAWYMDYVKNAYELGLMNGLTNDEFRVDANITVAQAITLAARMYATYVSFMGETVDFGNTTGPNWYRSYVDYAYKKGIINSHYYDTIGSNAEREATRAEFAEIISGALPSSAFSKINNYSSGVFTDVDAGTSTGRVIYMLYGAGVVTGMKDTLFGSSEKVNRGQVAAIITRMADFNKRVHI